MAIIAGSYGQSAGSDVTTTPALIYDSGANGAIPGGTIEVVNTGSADLYVYVVGLHGSDANKGTGKGHRIAGGGTGPAYPSKYFKLGVGDGLGRIYVSTASGTGSCDWALVCA